MNETPLTAAELCRSFASGRKAEKKVEEALRTLALLGQAEQVGSGYVLMQ